MSKQYTIDYMFVMDAFIKGKTIETKERNGDVWRINSKPVWNFVCFDYRVKKEIDIKSTNAYSIICNIRDAFDNGRSKEYVAGMLGHMITEVMYSEKSKKENEELSKRYQEYAI